MSNTASAWLKWALVFGFVPGSGGGGGGNFDPGQILWVSEGAGTGGNGSIAKPFGSVIQAYAAGVTSAAPFVVAVNPGTYNESATPLALVPYGSIYGFGSDTTTIQFGALTFDATAWDLDPGVNGRIGLYGFSMSAVSFDCAAPTSVSANFVMRDIVALAVASEKWYFRNLTDICSFADCTFDAMDMQFYGCFVRSPGTTYGSVTASTYDYDTATPYGNGRFEVSQRITALFVKAAFAMTQNVYLMGPEATALTSFFCEGDTINIFKTANIQNPIVSSGTPVITNIDSAENMFADYTPTNYTPTDDTIKGNLEGIDEALADAVNMNVVTPTAGYVELVHNTRYVIEPDVEGKIYFQTPATAEKGFYVEIWGAGGAPVSRWNLNTRVSQSFINGANITNIGPDRYAILEPSSPTDRISLLCTKANEDFTVGYISSAGLTIYEQLQVERNLYTVTIASRLAMYAMGQVDSAYGGPILRVSRSSDSAEVDVQPDLTFRASPLSLVTGGITLAQWMYGATVNIVTMYDQSGVSNDITGTALWIDSAGNVASMSSTNNPAMQFFGAQSLIGTLAGTYISPDLNIFALSQITNPSDSSIATLYAPANGDDSASVLNCIAFRIPPALTSMETYRGATLSTHVLPVTNTRLLLATRFDGVGNELTINGSVGSSVGSTGNFAFDTILLSARHEGGITTKQGYFKTACVLVYNAMSGGDYAAVQAWVNTNF